MGQIKKGQGEGGVGPCTKPLNLVHIVKGPDQKHHDVLEGDDFLHRARVCRHRKKNTCELLELSEICSEKAF